MTGVFSILHVLFGISNMRYERLCMETVPEAYSADCAGFEDISEILNLPLYPGFEPGSKVDTNFSELLLHLCIPVSLWVVEQKKVGGSRPSWI